ncbi:MAG: hypothetical protein IJK15_02585 [Bacteroidaceae bacterium]|nr:hypothetical protein [Bacteroidaceae bacterium]
MEKNTSSQKDTAPSLQGRAGGGSSGGGSSFGGDDIDSVIMGGITFRGASKSPRRDDNGKVKTKAKKKSYITGAHGSASSKKKADIRRARANRHRGS